MVVGDSATSYGVGTVIGVVAAVVFLGIIAYWCVWKRRQGSDSPSDELQPETECKTHPEPEKETAQREAPKNDDLDATGGDFVRVQSQHQAKRARADADDQEKRTQARQGVIVADAKLEGSLKFEKTTTLCETGNFDLGND
jgi:hypothetical protein